MTSLHNTHDLHSHYSSSHLVPPDLAVKRFFLNWLTKRCFLSPLENTGTFLRLPSLPPLIPSMASQALTTSRTWLLAFLLFLLHLLVPRNGSINQIMPGSASRSAMLPKAPPRKIKSISCLVSGHTPDGPSLEPAQALSCSAALSPSLRPDISLDLLWALFSEKHMTCPR